jgi:hypothetical protein
MGGGTREWHHFLADALTTECTPAVVSVLA